MNNPLLFNAAFSGIAGGCDAERWVTNGADLNLNQAIVAAAFTIDNFIPPIAGGATLSQAELLQSICEGIFSSRYLQNSDPLSYIVIAQSIADNFNAAQINLIPIIPPVPNYVVVTAQFNGNNPLPANTAIEHFYVVTTSGPNASIGQLIWDNGSNVGTTIVVPAATRVIITTQAFIGGTITFLADSIYLWDIGISTWVIIGGSTLAGGLREIRYPITNTATQDSATLIPGVAQIALTRLVVTTPYSGGTTVSIGQAGSIALLQTVNDNLATVANIYEVGQDTTWGGTDLAVRTTINGAPIVGNGFVIVFYSVPNG